MIHIKRPPVSTLWLLLCILFTVLPIGAEADAGGDAKKTLVRLSFGLDQAVYDYSDYGEPPQIAIWLEQPGKQRIKTLFVTRRTANADWHGKTMCPVSLPYWTSRFQKETGKKGTPGRDIPVPDGVSSATPKDKVTVTFFLELGTEWDYYIEMNVAGDFNRRFPSMLDNGMPDSQGNGQPSLLYRGKLKAIPGYEDLPKLMGRTMQLDAVDSIIEDLEGISDARKVLKHIKLEVPGNQVIK